MPLHPQAKAVLDLLAELDEPALETCTPTQARDIRARRQRPSSEPIHHTRDLDVGGVPARLYRPSDDAGLGLLVYFHGGGWVIGSLDTHDNVCRILSNSSGHAVLSIDYRLAPEHPYPAAVEDAMTAIAWAGAHAADLGCDPQRLAVGGDSAGANLAAVVAQRTDVPLRFQLLVYPATDLTCSFPSHVENAAGPGLTAEGIKWFVGHYVTDRSVLRDPSASPHFADDETVARSPQTLVITAELDPLRDEGDAYAARLAALGVPTSHVCFSGMYHGFFSLADFMDDAMAANRMAGTMVGRALSR